MNGKKTWGCKDKPPIVVSHSRGGIDVLETLYTDKAAFGAVRGWISIQSPFFGSHLASDYLEKKVSREQVQSLADFLKRNERTKKSGEDLEKQAPTVDLVNEAFAVLSVESREAYMKAHAADLAALLDSGLPIVTQGAIQPERKHLPELLEAPRDHLLTAHSSENDGVLLQGAARLHVPGDDAHAAPYVEIEGDHLSTVFDLTGRMKSEALATLVNAFLRFDSKRPHPLRSFQALLAMTVSRIEAREHP